MNERPAHLPPGTHLGEHYTIEGLVRLAEGRMFYLANDVRSSPPRRKCWQCGFEDNPGDATECAQCGQALGGARFLISARWDPDGFDAYQRYGALGLSHPGLAAPIDVFVVDEVLFSVVHYAGDGLMLDEAAPLDNERLLNVAQRVVGVLAFLHQRGVQPEQLTTANLLISPDGAVRLFDLDVEAVYDEPVPADDRGAIIASVGQMLRRYCDIEAANLADFLKDTGDGQYRDARTFGREIERKLPIYSPIRYPPVLGGMSDVGLTRQLNEDNWGWIRLSDRAKLYVVADGMGGHDGGEVASALAVQVICESAKARERESPQGDDAIEELLDWSFQEANNTVKANADARGTDMGTTLVCMLVMGDKVGLIANVGDSRGYLLRDGSLHQVSTDHSLVQKMVERGRITAEEARHHPHSNILLRTVGTERDVEIDIFRIELESGDKVLMCSDGLWGEVEDRDMESILNTYIDPRIAARELVRAAHHGGGKDNVTLMIVGVP